MSSKILAQVVALSGELQGVMQSPFSPSEFYTQKFAFESRRATSPPDPRQYRRRH
jgi:hypothetical protein